MSEFKRRGNVNQGNANLTINLEKAYSLARLYCSRGEEIRKEERAKPIAPDKPPIT